MARQDRLKSNQAKPSQVESSHAKSRQDTIHTAKTEALSGEVSFLEAGTSPLPIMVSSLPSKGSRVSRHHGVLPPSLQHDEANAIRYSDVSYLVLTHGSCAIDVGERDGWWHHTNKIVEWANHDETDKFERRVAAVERTMDGRAPMGITAEEVSSFPLIITMVLVFSLAVLPVWRFFPTTKDMDSVSFDPAAVLPEDVDVLPTPKIIEGSIAVLTQYLFSFLFLTGIILAMWILKRMMIKADMCPTHIFFIGKVQESLYYCAAVVTCFHCIHVGSVLTHRNQHERAGVKFAFVVMTYILAAVFFVDSIVKFCISIGIYSLNPLMPDAVANLILGMSGLLVAMGDVTDLGAEHYAPADEACRLSDLNAIFTAIDGEFTEISCGGQPTFADLTEMMNYTDSTTTMNMNRGWYIHRNPLLLNGLPLDAISAAEALKGYVTNAVHDDKQWNPSVLIRLTVHCSTICTNDERSIKTTFWCDHAGLQGAQWSLVLNPASAGNLCPVAVTDTTTAATTDNTAAATTADNT